MEHQVVVPQLWTDVFNRLFDAGQTNLDRSFNQLPDLDEIEKADISQARIAIFGGKKVGKSTYTNWLVNKILDLLTSRKEGAVGQGDNNIDENVASKESSPFLLYIDIDPGQAEFTPAGVISVSKITEPIHGLNSSHLSTPLISKYFGSVDINDGIEHYVKCVCEVLEFINQNESYKNAPWFLNTTGYVHHRGISFNCKALYMFKPTVVLQIMDGPLFLFDPSHVRDVLTVHKSHQRNKHFTSSAKFQIDETLLAELNYQFIKFDSVVGDLVPKTRKEKAKELRDNVLVSYFSKLSNQPEEDKLLTVTPKEVSLSSMAVGTMYSTLPYNDILKSMNGNLVALCHFPEKNFSIYTPRTRTRTISDMDENWRLPSAPLKNVADNSSKKSQARKYVLNGSRYSNEFHGYGIVRSIDSVNSILFIITPVPEEILKTRVNCIVTAGCVGLPRQLALPGLGNSSSGLGDDPDLACVKNRRSFFTQSNEAPRKQSV